MAKSLFNAANHEIRERTLRPGNYLAKITSIEDVERGRGSQFVMEFLAPEGKIRQGCWYYHENETAERIGKDDLKRICIHTGNRDIDLQEDPRTWDPLKNKPIAIAVRRQKDKSGQFVTYTKDGVTYDSLEIQFFADSVEELPSYDPDFDEDDEEEAPVAPAPPKVRVPTVEEIQENVSKVGRGSHGVQIVTDPPPPAGAPNFKGEAQFEDDVPF